MDKAPCPLAHATISASLRMILHGLLAAIGGWGVDGGRAVLLYRRADRADVDPVSRRSIVDDAATGGATWCNSQGKLHPTATFRVARDGWRASGGRIWRAVAGGVADAGDERIAGGVAPGRASAAAAVPGVGGGIARLLQRAAPDRREAAAPTQAPPCARAVPHSPAARRADGGATGGFRKGGLSKTGRGAVNVSEYYLFAVGLQPRCHQRKDLQMAIQPGPRLLHRVASQDAVNGDRDFS